MLGASLGRVKHCARVGLASSLLGASMDIIDEEVGDDCPRGFPPEGCWQLAHFAFQRQLSGHRKRLRWRQWTSLGRQLAPVPQRSNIDGLALLFRRAWVNGWRRKWAPSALFLYFFSFSFFSLKEGPKKVA